MFKDDKFIELKCSALSKDMKIKFAKYLIQTNLFEIYYINVDNHKIEEKLYKNKARAFNYLIDLWWDPI